MDLDRIREFYGKRIDRLFEEPGRPVTVVFREKHGDDQSACLNRDELERVCLTKLWSRYHIDYFDVGLKPTSMRKLAAMLGRSISSKSNMLHESKQGSPLDIGEGHGSRQNTRILRQTDR